MLEFRESQVLEHGWSFRQADGPADWLSVSRVPTNAHLDLMKHKLIPDPFIDLNEIDVEWVGEKTWCYHVDLPPISASARENGSQVVLVFEGLDTFAHVRLNGETILQTDNMFLSHRVDITQRIKGANTLEIDFEPALLKAREIQKQHPEHKWVGFNADLSRLAVRKAQYHWGWDWGPVLMTAGPWRPLRLETYHACVKEIRVDYHVTDNFESVEGTISVEVEGAAAHTVAVDIDLQGKSVFKGTATVTDGVATISFTIPDVCLWYPHGYGPQSLYTVNTTLKRADQGLDHRSQTMGFRRVELIQKLDEVGRSFYFHVNGVDIFCGGSDWIPADSFLPSITEGRYRRWLKLMVDGNQVMVRVWGGGIYEEDHFYKACDELGLLVWQDFMFGCGNYPTFPAFLASVQQEAEQNVRRLRHHPCMALWAGNNEDYQVQEQEGLEYEFDEDKDPQSWLRSNFSARYIYEKVLPDVVKQECPDVPYHPGSPWGDGKLTSDPKVGDMHQWNVWHGSQEKYQIFETLGGRFNSEFGMEAFPNIQTIDAFVTKKAQMYPQSHTLDFHNKADGHERRLATYLVENFRLSADLEKYVHLTQVVQADALMYAYRGWRRQWGQKRRCGGALVWQINDCWPGTSWAIVDYFLRKKAAYYALSRVLAPIAIGVQREHHDWSVAHARPAKSSKFQLWVVSSKVKSLKATATLRFISIETGLEIKPAITEDISLAANGTTEVLQGVIDNIATEPHVLASSLSVDGAIISRDVDWPQPYKYLPFADRGIQVCQPCNEESGVIRVSAKRPVKALVFEERDGVTLSDNAIDVVPGDEQIVGVSGLSATSAALKYQYID